MLMHSEWGGKHLIDGASVLDVFAGTGALGLEALSRGAGTACFIEKDAAALRALRANVAACRAQDRTGILDVDVLSTLVGSPAVSRKAASIKDRRRRDEGPDEVPRHRAGISVLIPTGHDDSEARDVGQLRNGRDTGHDREARPNKDGVATTAPASLVFFDPPYGQDLVPRALAWLRQKGLIRPEALVIAEIGRDDAWRPEQPLLAERQHGAARILIFRLDGQ